MSEKKDEKRKPKEGNARKKWNRPAIQTGKLFEVNALACGKNSGGTGACAISGLSS
jgi:hypothetical protein